MDPCTDDGNPCTSDFCSGGSCAHLGIEDGRPCDDGLPCTQNDACVTGGCTGTTFDCPAADLACVDRSCDGQGGCIEQVKAGWCLVDGACVAGGSQLPGNPCTKCDAASSTVEPMPDGSPCTDGSICTEADSCLAGTCQPGEPGGCGEVQVNQSTGSHRTQPRVEVAKDGRVVVAWQYGAGQITPGGVSFIVLDKHLDPTIFEQSVALNGEKLNALALRPDGIALVSAGFKVIGFQLSGMKAALPDVGGAYDVAVFSDNSFIVRGNGAPTVRRITAAGLSVGPEVTLTNDVGNAGGPLVARSDGSYVGVMNGKDAAGVWYVRQRVVSSQDLPQGNVVTVSEPLGSYQANATDAAELPDGRWIVIYNQDGGFYPSGAVRVTVAMREFTGAGVKGPERFPSVVSSVGHARGRIAVFPDGTFMLCWSSQLTEAGSGVIRVRRFDAEGAPDSPEQVLEGSEGAAFSDCAGISDADGKRAVLVFSRESASGFNNIFARNVPW